MNVIAINEYKNDFPVAVVEIPEGKTGDETFVAWVRSVDPIPPERTDQKILEEALYAWSELEVITSGE